MLVPRLVTVSSATFQRDIARRDIEDAETPQEKWGVDRAESDAEDLDPLEGDVPIHTSVPRSIPGTVPGKTSVRASISDWTDDDDSDADVRILEVFNPLPLRYSLPVPGTSADPNLQAIDAQPINVSAPPPAAPRRGVKCTTLRKPSGATKRQKVGTSGPSDADTPRRQPTVAGSNPFHMM